MLVQTKFYCDTLRTNGYLSVQRGCEIQAPVDYVQYGLITSGSIVLYLYLTVRAANKNITTLEGVQKECQGICRIFLADEGDQCGYCAPGFIMTCQFLQ